MLKLGILGVHREIDRKLCPSYTKTNLLDMAFESKFKQIIFTK